MVSKIVRFMFESARNKMPASDYVSIVSSLFSDTRALWVGTLAAALASAVSGYAANANILYVVAGLFCLMAVWRNKQSQEFKALNIDFEDVKLAEKWELKATLSGVAAALLFGAWCFISLVVVRNEFAVLTCTIVSMAATVGIVARNYGVDRLVSLQLLFLMLPLCAGLVMDGNIYHVFLAILFVPMMMSYRTLAAGVRKVFLNAVHDRVEVARLAGELDGALSTMSHGLMMLDEQKRIVVTNGQVQEMLFGENNYNCMGKGFSDIINQGISVGKLTPLAGQRLASVVANENESTLLIKLLDGRHCEISISRNGAQTVLVMADITERVQAESRITFMARFDAATNLPNRAYFSEQVGSRLRQIQQSGQAQKVGMLVIDIDDFKSINDDFGHPMGDRVLAMVARRLRQALDSSVIVGRFGGDEFVAFFEQNVCENSTPATVKHALGILAAPFNFDQQNFEISSSAGLVINSSDECDLEKLLKRADMALYGAKGDGKGKLTVFCADMCAAYRNKLAMKTALSLAIENDQLQLAYQPVIDMNTRKVIGCEALARWHDPELGIIPPFVFIPLAEEMGVISKITDWALRSATKECMTWPNNIGVAVNISALDFRGQNVQEMVYSALNQSGLSPERLEIEVTESVLVEELETASKVLSEISCQGVGIALDDFGTGYSSLGYLHDLPFTKLKIDRTFTMDVTTDPKAKKLMRNIAVLGRDLNMKITVEGVETEEQLEVIANIGLMDSVQGYLFGAPVPQSEIAELIFRLSGHTDTHIIEQGFQQNSA